MKYANVIFCLSVAVILAGLAACDSGGMGPHYVPNVGLRIYYTLDSALNHAEAVYELKIEYQHIDSIPIAVTAFSKVGRFSMRGNNIANMPSFLYSLTPYYYDFSNNRLDSINTSAINPYVDALYLDSNRISALPVELSKLRYIECLSLDYNKIQKISPEIRLLAYSLDELSVVNNPLAPGMIDSLKKWLPETWVRY